MCRHVDHVAFTSDKVLSPMCIYNVGYRLGDGPLLWKVFQKIIDYPEDGGGGALLWKDFSQIIFHIFIRFFRCFSICFTFFCFFIFFKQLDALLNLY